MKVLVLINHGVGLYKFRKELLEALINNNFEVYASLPSGAFIEQIEDLGCHYIETNINRRGTNIVEELDLYNTYKRIIKDIKPDVVLTYTIKCNIYGGLACKKYGVPYISNITGLGSALENKGKLQLLLMWLYKKALAKASKIFFQNQDNLNFMLNNHIVKEKYDLIPGSGVNLDYYKYCKYPDDKKVNFVFAGRMMKEKGFDQYLEAAEYIHQKHPNTKFYICGIKEEDYKERVDDLVSKGVCEYHGLVDDMRSIYNQIHCIIHPTYYPEGMSNVLLEACACGRPGITTDRAGCKEIIDDGINGYIVKKKDTRDLIEKIELFLSLDYKEKEQMGKNARKKVENYFDRSIIVNKYLNEIRKIENEKD